MEYSRFNQWDRGRPGPASKLVLAFIIPSFLHASDTDLEQQDVVFYNMKTLFAG